MGKDTQWIQECWWIHDNEIDGSGDHIVYLISFDGIERLNASSYFWHSSPKTGPHHLILEFWEIAMKYYGSWEEPRTLWRTLSEMLLGSYHRNVNRRMTYWVVNMKTSHNFLGDQLIKEIKEDPCDLSYTLYMVDVCVYVCMHSCTHTHTEGLQSHPRHLFLLVALTAPHYVRTAGV